MILLALDVGNTRVTAGVFQGRRLIRRGRIPTRELHSRTSASQALRRLLRSWSLRTDPVGEVILSSVVPRAEVPLSAAVRQLTACRPWVVGKNITAPVINRYRIASQVGQDRLVNAVAAYHLYGGPAIVVDFGTALTIDLVTARREYLGGMIAPGLESSLSALIERTALLPKISLTPPRTFLGRDTAASMRSGLFYGYGALCDGLTGILKRKHAPKAKVIATGGHAGLIAPFCRTVQLVNSDLTLQGLELTYRLAKKSY